jgi:diguanylate cyclase (GGDEF)-like protein
LSAEAVAARSARRGWGYPGNRPFFALTVIALIIAVQAFASALWPPNEATNTALNAALGGIALVIALLSLLASGKRDERFLNVPLACAILLISVFTWGTSSGQGQMLCGFTMVMLGLFAAYFLPRNAAYAQLALLVLTFTLALIVNPHLITPLYGIVMVVIITIVVLVVASLVTHLRDEAIHDPLTGAFNRRGLAEHAAAAHDLDVRGHRPTCVVEIDLDGFKAYNDVHGHSAGDALLEEAVNSWSRQLRRSDVLARTGGDEFVLVLPDTDEESAERLLSRMRSDTTIRWSAGVSRWTEGDPIAAAIDRADQSLYRNKSQRRP